ncbi:LLM class flavin-dependent oxidoreductase, partial [Streptomyces sp. NPDC000405]|uniref:LLM class flavin-dependent oxidoreductase n=1 Tax=Streptomyces sp. NPDC000405 TaxID=3161033 RepID=UPI00398CD6B5
MTRHLHINVNILNAGVFGGSWRYPGTDGLTSYTVEHYTSIAKKAEEAKLDAVFLADGPVVEPLVRHRPGNNLEPTTVLARIAARTERIGLIGTLSSSYNDPAELARRVGDLDHLSGGRVVGFLPQVTEVLDQVHADGQRMLFSATLDRDVD